MVFNKPYDESVEVSDAEEVTSAQASPRDQAIQQVSITVIDRAHTCYVAMYGSTVGVLRIRIAYFCIVL